MIRSGRRAFGLSGSPSRPGRLSVWGKEGEYLGGSAPEGVKAGEDYVLHRPTCGVGVVDGGLADFLGRADVYAGVFVGAAHPDSFACGYPLLLA